MIDGVWGESPPASARNALQVHVSGLRKLLAGAAASPPSGPAILGVPGGYILDVPDDWVDALVAEWLLKVARVALLRGDSGAAGKNAARALDLWSGLELAGVGDAHFVDTERPRLRQMRLALTELEVDAFLSLGRHAEVISIVEAALVDNPFHEGLWRRLMLALYRSGRGNDALAAYDRATDILRDELGLDPGPELAGMQAAILRRDDSDPPSGDPAHGAEPLAVPGPAASRAVTSLPYDTTGLIGRVDEVRAVTAILGENERLVTILGPGGIGKTRVAIEAARAFALDRGCPASFVDLSPTDTARTALNEILVAVGGHTAVDDATAALAAALGAEPRLLVLDNVEQLDGHFSQAAVDLLAAVPSLSLLMTSRVALNVPSEARYVLRPMHGADAVALFGARARRVVHGFVLDDQSEPLVRELCRTLDHVPLAVVLAAARLRVVPLGALTAHLNRNLLDLRGARDTPERHRTLRAAIAGSVAMLTGDAARVLRLLSVFRGGFTLRAASAVVELDDLDTVEHIEALIDSSLVVGPAAEDMRAGFGDPRFALLEPIRQFLDQSFTDPAELDRARERHAAHYLHWFTEGGAGIADDPTGSAVAADFANLDLALRHFAGRQNAFATGLLAAVYRRLSMTGRLMQMGDCVDAALGSGERSENDDALLRTMRGHIGYQADVNWRGGDDFVGAVDTVIRLGEPSYTAVIGCCYCASYLVDRGDLVRASDIAASALAMARALERPAELGLALSAAQYVARFANDVERAVALGIEAVQIARRGGDRIALANTLSELVSALVLGGRGAETPALAAEAERLVEDSDGPQMRSIVARAVARSRIGIGQPAAAVEPLMQMIANEGEQGLKFIEAGWVALVLETLDPALAAATLGCAFRLSDEMGDPDIMPPDSVAGGLVDRLTAAYPDEVERGRRSGWGSLKREVEARTDSE